ncbi:MAG: ParB/RepB/Spo0J family partition protein [Gammaproteobacteria bacterium]|nr:ParB/RepB/Spo0J family partition protein [Gammaproteobacteria bacterium]MCD8525574.1 ParB/RepB/Spo0J family partition protein [Gammaproteobacteria bacterium]MCD8542281.1 ParB/RepB/Spo0J family partition protein [Gammaproteobacteria bacterium]
MKKRGLGRSLNAILSSSAAPVHTEERTISGDVSGLGIRVLSVTQLQRGTYQPRREMDENTINELAASIKAQGILQPIIVRKKGDNFEIIAGERRWRAAQKAGLEQVPVIIKDIPDDAAMAIGLIENIQRENLNAMDEAFGFQRLSKEFSLTHQEIADAVGRSRASISNLLRLLHLPEAVQRYLQHGDIEMGHARALLGLPLAQQLAAAEYVVEKNLSVRETENYIKQLQHLAENSHRATDPLPSSQMIELENQLSKFLGAKVGIQQNISGKGKVFFTYSSEAELNIICQKILARN